MDKTINKTDINKWIQRFDTEKPLYEVDVKIMFAPYSYNQTVNEFIKYAYENNWVNADYQIITDAWNGAEDKINFIKQLGPEDVFRLISFHIRGERFFSGLLAAAFDNGYIQSALKRLQEI